jgi:flavin reductase (DIM6/NTAB) family NADH-FMN oxidoreductase RutF
MPSDKVKPPRIAESAVHMECKLKQVIELEDDDGKVTTDVVIGRVRGRTGTRTNAYKRLRRELEYHHVVAVESHPVTRPPVFESQKGAKHQTPQAFPHWKFCSSYISESEA